MVPGETQNMLVFGFGFAMQGRTCLFVFVLSCVAV